MKKVILFLSIISLYVFDSYCQEFNDSVYIHLTNFLFINGELKLEDIEKNSSKDLIYIKKLIDNDNSIYGVYTFYATVNNNVKVSAFIVNNDKIEIFDMSKVNAFYSRLFLLFDEYPDDFDRTNILKYLNSVSDMLDRNEVDSIENMLIQVRYRNYSYFINSKNIKNSKGFLPPVVRSMSE